jgi:23S rRNA maturation-related 3'-5' exoribonuclease YhaM
LLERNETNSSGDTLGQEKRRGNNWMNRIKHELERLGMGEIWNNGRNNDKEVRIRIRKMCVDIERQTIEATVRERGRERETR